MGRPLAYLTPGTQTAWLSFRKKWASGLPWRSSELPIWEVCKQMLAMEDPAAYSVFVTDRHFWISLVGVKDSHSLCPGPQPPDSKLVWMSDVPGLEDLTVGPAGGSPGDSGSELKCRAFQGPRGPRLGLPPGVLLWHENRSEATAAPISNSPHFSAGPSGGRCGT